MENIHPIFDRILSTRQKEELLAQRSLVIWMIGLSGSGKSTLARALENHLHSEGFLTALLDGDNLRSGINSNLGFSEEDRVENIRRAAEVANILSMNGVITICSLITPREELRQMSRQILGERYYEVYINCPLEVCEKRDVKGLYRKARAGEIRDFTGIDAPFDEPGGPDLEIRTDLLDEERSLKELVGAIVPLLRLEK